MTMPPFFIPDCIFVQLVFSIIHRSGHSLSPRIVFTPSPEPGAFWEVLQRWSRYGLLRRQTGGVEGHG